jgi:hypothetical protein
LPRVLGWDKEVPNMDETDSQLESRRKYGNSRFLLICVGSGAIFAASAAVVSRWRNFDALAKLNAIVFLALLLISPIREIFYYRRGRKPLGLFDGLIVGYMLTMLALTLFAFR